VWNGSHPETGEKLEVVDDSPEGVPAYDLPPQPAVFAPDYAPEELAEIAAKLRKHAGLSKEPTGIVAEAPTRSSQTKPKTTARRRKSTSASR
jgi:Mn-containing catalase